MADKWLNGLVVFFVLAVNTDAARSQQTNLWGVDGLDAPLPSAPKPADMEGARGERVSGIRSQDSSNTGELT